MMLRTTALLLIVLATTLSSADAAEDPPSEASTNAQAEGEKVPLAGDCPYDRKGAGHDEYRTAAMIYNSEGKPFAAEACFKKAFVEAFPTLAALSEFSFRRNDKRAALAYSEILTQMDPTGDTQLVYAIRLMQAGEHERALPVLQRLAEANPDMAQIWHKLGIALIRTKGAEAATPALKRAAELDPENFASELEDLESLMAQATEKAAGSADSDRGDDLTVRDVGERDL
jgi:tetratricopeptide (TPR) repeat protein